MRPFLVGVSLLVAGCVDSSRPTTAPALPARVLVTLTSAIYAPAKPDGKPWDGFGHAPTALVEAVGNAMKADAPYIAIAALLANPTIDTVSKPEPKGRATMFVAGAATPTTLIVSPRDTYLAQWTPVPSWTVALNDSPRLRVELVDADIAFDDPADVFEISTLHIVDALQKGDVLEVRVDDQTGGAVLFAGLSVMAAR